MTELDARTDPEEDTGYGASVQGEMEDAPDQDQPQTREPAPDEEAEQDNYANTDDQAS